MEPKVSLVPLLLWFATALISKERLRVMDPERDPV